MHAGKNIAKLPENVGMGSGKLIGTAGNKSREVRNSKKRICSYNSQKRKRK